MTLRAGNVTYFVFAAADQSRIDVATVATEDVAYSDAPTAAAAYPQTLRVRFTLSQANATQPWPRVRPLAPGSLTFIPAPGSAAAPTPANATAANYANFPTIGTLVLDLMNTKGTPVLDRLLEISALPLVPDRIWYGSVNLTQDFLFQSLAALGQGDVLTGSQGAPIKKGTSDWTRHAVAGFLKGRYHPVVRPGATETDDDLSKVAEWPTVIVDPNTAQAELLITMATTAKPFDGLPRDLENPTNIPEDDPAHPHFGAVPARAVYQLLRSKMPYGDMVGATPGATGTGVAEKVLETATANNNVPKYYPVRFTRVWKPIEDRSVHFPSQVLVVRRNDVGNTLFCRQRLPIHGVFFLGLTAIQALAVDFSFGLENPGNDPAHDTTWLAGETANSWRSMGTKATVNYDLSAGIPHIVVRRRMGQEIIFDRGDRPTQEGLACTYFSLRRAVRALANNRIAGGRLNFEVFFRHGRIVNRNLTATRGLVRDALGGDATKILDGAPDPLGDVDLMAPSLRPVLEQFFPNPSTDPTLAASAACQPTKQLGWSSYYVWQSGTGVFAEPVTGCNFADAWLGRGGAGALVASALASGYALDPSQNLGETTAAFADRTVGDMLDGRLEPGAELQFWRLNSHFSTIKNRGVADANFIGHSPTFLKYQVDANGNRVGIVVIDQSGEQTCPTVQQGGNRKLKWSIFEPEAWIAANWVE